ncbi:MAG: cell surface protein SprA [Rhodothermales bacterium]|nr:cell surface protein SprA [Rhodothermales bacterium]MBO6779182.1 cell surface protein SprA [Rhodothermales bacterium]
MGSAVVAMVLVGQAAPDQTGALRTWSTPRIAVSDTDSVHIALDRLRVAADSDSTVLDFRRLREALEDPRYAALRDWPMLAARADTDSVFAVLLADLRLDSLTVTPDTGLSARYRPRWQRDLPSARFFPRDRRPFGLRYGNYWRQQTEVDTTRLRFTTREQVGSQDVRYPVEVDFNTYRQLRLRYDLNESWEELVVEHQRQLEQRRRGGLGFNVVVPGGRESAFTTIFGTSEVDLRVNGQADIRAGFDYRKSDQQVAFTGRPSQLDPDFKQDLRLGITGSIGDKLQIDVNYDSQNQFDYQNQLKLHYQGYDDEIVQSIEAGNVFLQTPSTLIRGGQSLFGIKSEFQVGGVHLTTVMSQQEGQSNSLSIDGGSETTEYDLKPTDYDDNTHFFLGYYFRNRWEDALADPPNIRVADGFEGIKEIEVWRLQPTTPEELNVRQVVAMVDLGESEELLSQADGYTAERLPSNAIDQYDDAAGGEVDSQLRDGAATPGSYLESSKNLSSSDYQIGRMKRLERGRDYDFDEVLGYISLRQRLQESEALAVSFRYTAGGRAYQVGDFSTDTGGSDGGQNEDKLVMKLLRPVQLRQPAPESNFNPAAWYLELRNIYRLPGRGINANEFQLQVYYEPPGQTASRTLPGVGGQQTLLQMLGLDRVNEDQALKPDDLFDFLVNYTIEPGDGLLIYPYLQPFGDRMQDLIAASGGSEELEDLYVFRNLYSQKKANARRDSQHDVYRIRGEYSGTVSDFYDLRAYAGLIPGSVRVTSGGTPLQENADFIVDYTGGTVTITNPAFLTAGREINIEYEQNSFFNLQKKTLLGARADYSLDDRISLGATLMRLTQKSPIDKFRIGEEPVSNTIWGVDGSFQAEPRWLTRAVDALPLIQTREPSRVAFTGEFAQLRPNHVETIAFTRTRRDLRKADRDFAADELAGISYIDDFEGFENTFSLMQPGTWSLTAAPDSIGAVDGAGVRGGSVSDSLRTTWRGTFAWYRINANMLAEVPAVAYNVEAIKPLQINDVFPNRDTRAELIDQLETLDIYFNPSERGPYNYTTELKNFLSKPEDTWGGMAQRLPEGFTDFSLKNIDFVEFVFRPFPENPADDAGAQAKLYVDLGSISEDILPNEKLNNEDGLTLSTVSEGSIQKWGRSPNATQNSVVDIDDATNRTEDLGLDGLASYGGDYPPFSTETQHFADFVSSLNQSDPDPRYRAEVAKALVDPSGDDYHYFGNSEYYENPAFYPTGATFQQRFSRYFAGHELNAFETQTKLATNTSVKRGNSRFPDSEDRNLNSTVDTDNSYFQYELPLQRAKLDSLAAPGRVDDYVVGEIADAEGVGTGWYQVRIPVQEFTRKVGNIQDFSLIESIRIWTTGHQVPVTIRFAALELVGSQWQKSERITLERSTVADTARADTRLTISSINNEENADLYSPPIGAVVSQTRLASGRVQNAREQSLVLRVENLLPGKQRAIFKTQNTALDLLKYSNVRMFTHLHGELADGSDLANLPIEEAREKVKLFVRIGANESNDYYEYEQPLTPSSEAAGSSDALWGTAVEFNGEIQDLNSVNIDLGALNQLKVARDRLAFPPDSIFYNVVGDTLVSPDAPDAEEFAPPGTRLGIKGTPSLGRVNSVVIGIRNASDSTSTAFDDILEDISVWVNELRVAGYDETNGWAGLANLDLELADFGRIKANFQRQTDGFGSLSSTLGDREQTSINNWSVTSEVNMDKLIPERFGWTIPVNVQVQSNTQTPRFAPTRGDVRLEELLSQIDEREDLEEPEKEELRTDAIESAQTYSFTRSVTTRFAKTGSRSRVLRNTVDGIGLTYSYSDAEGRNPSQVLNDNWRWSSTASYRFSTRRPRTLKPFWFLDPIPVVGMLADLRFNYLPQSLSTSGTLNRNLSQTRERPVLAAGDTSSIPLSVRFPLREKHAFGHQRNFTLQYNPFGFLNLSFDTNTTQSLNAAGVDTTFAIAASDTLFPGFSLQQAIDAGLVDSSNASRFFELESLEVKPFDQVLRSVLTGGADIRAERHDQKFTATFRPRLQNINALNWIALQDVAYDVTYNWQNGPLGRNTGAAIRNQVDLRAGVSLRIQEFWRKFGFYKAMEEAQRAHDSEKQRERQQREQERRRANDPNARRPQPVAPADSAAVAADSTGGGFKLPLPNLKVLARRTVLGLTGIRDFSVTYNGTRSSTSSNVGQPVLNQDSTLAEVVNYYSILDAFQGRGPSLGYRFGFDRQFDIEDRIIDPSLQVSDQLDNSNRFQGRTTLNPSQALQVSVNWNVDWTDGQTFTYRPVVADGTTTVIGVDTTLTQNGTNKSSIWAFGASYLDLFQAQFDTYVEDLAASAEEDPILLGDENGDGRVVLTNESVVRDFRDAFVRGSTTIDQRNLLPIPRPNWSITYSGLSDWPLIRAVVQSLSLRHGYSADYSADYNTVTFAGDDSVQTVDLGSRRIVFDIPEYQTGSVRINERYQPLIGMDIGWKKQINTALQYNKSNSFSLSTSNLEVSENKTSELSFSLNYQKTGMRLPFFGGKRLNNRASIGLTVARSTTVDRRLRLRTSLESAIDNPEFQLADVLTGDNVTPVTAHTRLTLSPVVSYQFSNRVSANFTLKYEKFDSEDSRQPSATQVQGNFNIRVSIAN